MMGMKTVIPFTLKEHQGGFQQAQGMTTWQTKSKTSGTKRSIREETTY